MDIYVVDNNYQRQELVDAYSSAIWTERFKGNGDFELNLPIESSQLDLVPTGTLLECDGSDQPMVVEEIDIEGAQAKLTGITVTEWFNNRFIRSSSDHTVKTWDVTNVPIGQLIANIVQNWCVDSSYLSGGDMGFDANYLKIPGLSVAGYADHDTSGAVLPNFTGSIDFGPVYDTISQFASDVNIGLKTYFHDSGSGQRVLWFEVYKGTIRTSGATPVIFSPSFESINNLKELQSEADHWNDVYMFLSEVADLSTQPDYNYGGYVWTNWTYRWQNGQTRPNKTPWDIRSRMEFSGITQDEYDAMPIWDGVTPPIRPDTPVDQELYKLLADHHFVHLIDGDIPANAQYIYGEDYRLGDVVAMQGYFSDIIAGQITEFIRSKDQEGEKAFPTVETFPGVNVVWRSELP